MGGVSTKQSKLKSRVTYFTIINTLYGWCFHKTKQIEIERKVLHNNKYTVWVVFPQNLTNIQATYWVLLQACPISFARSWLNFVLATKM